MSRIEGKQEVGCVSSPAIQVVEATLASASSGRLVPDLFDGSSYQRQRTSSESQSHGAAGSKVTVSKRGRPPKMKTIAGKSIRKVGMQCKAGNPKCSLEIGKSADSGTIGVVPCDICCSESGFCRDCLCILCGKTINGDSTNYSFIRCLARLSGAGCCGHAAHLLCALECQMAGVVKQLGIDMEYICRRCDRKMDLREHVVGLLDSLRYTNSRIAAERSLEMALQIMQGTEHGGRGARSLETLVKTAIHMVRKGSNVKELFDMLYSEGLAALTGEPSMQSVDRRDHVGVQNAVGTSITSSRSPCDVPGKQVSLQSWGLDGGATETSICTAGLTSGKGGNDHGTGEPSMPLVDRRDHAEVQNAVGTSITSSRSPCDVPGKQVSLQPWGLDGGATETSICTAGLTSGKGGNDHGTGEPSMQLVDRRDHAEVQNAVGTSITLSRSPCDVPGKQVSLQPWGLDGGATETSICTAGLTSGKGGMDLVHSATGLLNLVSCKAKLPSLLMTPDVPGTETHGVIKYGVPSVGCGEEIIHVNDGSPKSQAAVYTSHEAFELAPSQQLLLGPSETANNFSHFRTSVDDTPLQLLTTSFEKDVHQALDKLQEAQAAEYKLAHERLSAQKEYIVKLYEQLDAARCELAHQLSKSPLETFDALMEQVSGTFKELEKERTNFQIMLGIGNGFGQTSKDILNELFGLSVEQEKS